MSTLFKMTNRNVIFDVFESPWNIESPAFNSIKALKLSGSSSLPNHTIVVPNHPDGRWRANERRIRLWQHRASAAQWRLSEPRRRTTKTCRSQHKLEHELEKTSQNNVDSKNLQKPPRKRLTASGIGCSVAAVWKRWTFDDDDDDLL